jgi:hypothetical protein
MELLTENDGWRRGSGYVPLPRGRYGGLLMISSPQYNPGIRQTTLVENPFLHLDK